MGWGRFQPASKPGMAGKPRQARGLGADGASQSGRSSSRTGPRLPRVSYRSAKERRRLRTEVQGARNRRRYQALATPLREVEPSPSRLTPGRPGRQLVIGAATAPKEALPEPPAAGQAVRFPPGAIGPARVNGERRRKVSDGEVGGAQEEREERQGQARQIRTYAGSITPPVATATRSGGARSPSARCAGVSRAAA
jgi:hypothetical protein